MEQRETKKKNVNNKSNAKKGDEIKSICELYIERNVAKLDLNNNNDAI